MSSILENLCKNIPEKITTVSKKLVLTPKVGLVVNIGLHLDVLDYVSVFWMKFLLQHLFR
ncbi:hypothetical protein MTR_4g027115 [Medicago truncatula]|uniref:Uncharacterized protein n=1 Tax=Medicago truncatula TaxID=3880 RepID=A0A072UJ77_MEDTR|nr:hypothetical protein MTR_4g027115 [Medicago truncatula]